MTDAHKPRNDLARAGKITIDGVYELVRNPSRRWWQLWKPRLVPGELQQFSIVAIGGTPMPDDEKQARAALGPKP